MPFLMAGLALHCAVLMSFGVLYVYLFALSHVADLLYSVLAPSKARGP